MKCSHCHQSSTGRRKPKSDPRVFSLTDRLAQALDRYGVHDGYCLVMRLVKNPNLAVPDNTCTCGLSAIRSEYADRGKQCNYDGCQSEKSDMVIHGRCAGEICDDTCDTFYVRCHPFQ